MNEPGCNFSGFGPLFAQKENLMRSLICTLSILLVNSLPAAEPAQLRVLTYNIHHAEGTDQKLDLDRIARIIRDLRPDLVALQEVDYSVGRSGNVDQGAELAKRTGLHLVSGPNIDYQGGRYGNAVLSRWPIVAQKNHALPESNTEQRGVLDVRVSPEGGLPNIRFLATHLDHRPDDAERLASAAFINQLLDDRTEPAILAGDLNATPESNVLKRFGTLWQNANETETLPTIPAGKPARQIDFVLYRPAERWKVIETNVIDEPIASDHRPLFVVLEWTPK